MRGAALGRGALSVFVGGAERGAGNGFSGAGSADGADGAAGAEFGGAPKFGAWPIGGEEVGKKEERAGKDFHGPRPFRGNPLGRFPE